LRVNRLYGPQEAWVRGSTFADAFQGGCWPERTSEYRISRWETAVVRVPYTAIRRYEELLGLPANSLVAVVDTIYRYATRPDASAPQLDRGLAGGSRNHLMRVEELVERARSDAPMTGSDWDELSALLAAAPGLVIAPRSAWTEVSERLMSEMIIAHGVAWMQRYEAFNRLLAHPAGQQPAVAVCASLAADRGTQVFVETVSVLDASPHPEASRHVLDQLLRPTNDRAQYGALLACIRKLRYGHFNEAQILRLVPIVNELMLDPGRYDDTQSLAAELLRQLPGNVSTAAKSRLRRSVAADPMLQQVLTAGRLATAEAGRVLIERIANTAVATMPRDVPNFHDRLLPALLDEMLFSPVFDVRLYAAMLLSSTPYHRPLAFALAAELANRGATRSADVAHAMIEALRVLGEAEHREIIERLITAEGVPASITLVATRAIGHIAGRSDDGFWKSAIAHHGQLWHRTQSDTNASALSWLIYGLGMTRNNEVLQLVRDDPETPAVARAAAAWWLNLPRRVYEGARS
jgi:hypothetical protein